MVPRRRGGSAGGRAAGHRAGRRHARHAVPRPGPPPGMEGPAARRARRRGLRLEGRPLARGDPQRDRQPGGGGAALRDRRHLLRHPPRALSGRHHGDVSPKNILVGPHGPVFLDAECAWYGDPAFDLAFCLNHLLLKCLWVPQAKSGFLNCFAALRGGYLERMSYEDPKSLEARTAALLPALLLARVDGKSPVEYLTDGKDLVRRVARALLAQPPATLGEIQKAWQESLR